MKLRELNVSTAVLRRVSVSNQKTLKKGFCRRLGWSDKDSSPTKEIRTPVKKNERTSRTAKTMSEASTDSTESTIRCSTRKRQTTPSRFMKYYQCITANEGKGQALSIPNNTRSRSGNQQLSIRTDALTLEEILEKEEDLQPGPSKSKKSVISGRVSKRQNPKKSKAVKVLSDKLQKEGENLLDFDVGGEIQSFKWTCKEPKYKCIKEVPGVSIAIMVSVPAFGQSMWYLKIEPGKVKPKSLTNKHSMGFFVIEGQGEVGVGDKRQMLTAPATFIIPKGCEYYIKNVSKAKPMILGFTRNLPPDGK